MFVVDELVPNTANLRHYISTVTDHTSLSHHHIVKYVERSRHDMLNSPSTHCHPYPKYTVYQKPLND